MLMLQLLDIILAKRHWERVSPPGLSPERNGANDHNLFEKVHNSYCLPPVTIQNVRVHQASSRVDPATI